MDRRTETTKCINYLPASLSNMVDYHTFKNSIKAKKINVFRLLRYIGAGVYLEIDIYLVHRKI